MAGIGLAGNNIVMEYAGTARDIPLYTALYNAVTALPRAAAPLLGGLLADRLGYAPVFWLAGGPGAGEPAADPARPRAAPDAASLNIPLTFPGHNSGQWPWMQKARSRRDRRGHKERQRL